MAVGFIYVLTKITGFIDNRILVLCFMIVFTALVYTETHFSRVFVRADLLVSSLFSSMSLNLLYKFSIFLLASCKIMLHHDTLISRWYQLSHLIRYKEVVTPGYFLHDVSLNQIILQDSHAVINQDGRLGGLHRAEMRE